MSFKNFGLLDELLKSIAEEGYTEPTPVQEQVIPLIMEGSDLMVGSQTGSGKTAGFTLPILHRLKKPLYNTTQPQGKPQPQVIRALILTPTRELAAQVGESVKAYGKYLPLKSTTIFGGVNFSAQVKSLRRGVDIIIATPGRILDHVTQRTVDLSKIEILVLDEADRMLDMGFIHDIRRLLTLLPKTRQNLLFSATFSEGIKKLADGLMNSPKMIQVTRRNTTAENVTQVIYPVDHKRKRELLSFLISSENWKQVLVFTRTKHCAGRLSEQLQLDGISSTAIHGNKSQGARAQALSDFKRGAVRVLVATDIAARGLDIEKLPHVVNYELPNVPEDYVHRVGRTGRAGNEGKAISLVCIDEHKFLRDIERLLKIAIPTVVVPGYAPDPTIKAVPIPTGRNSWRGGPSMGGGGARRSRPSSQGQGSGSTSRPPSGRSFSSRPPASRPQTNTHRPTKRTGR